MNNMFYCSFVSIHYIICECGDTFPTEEALKEHLENDHKSTTIERNEYQCSTCDKIFPTERACLIHQHVHTRKSRRQLQDGTELKKKYYANKNIVCEFCGKRYASNAALRYHQRVHTGERPYQCTMCPKNFTMPLFLQIHVRTHTGERPYECPMCPKAFSNKAALLRHDRKVCSRSVLLSLVLIQVEVIACDLCPAVDVRRLKLLRRQQYNCATKVHTGIKPYECPQCGKFFTQSNSMKLHVKTVHLKMPAPYKSKSRRLKQALKQLTVVPPVNVAVEVEDGAYEQPTVVKSEIQEYEQQENEVYEDEGYEILYQEEPRYEEVKVEISEIPMYEQEDENEQPEVMYEEVYEMEEM